MVVTGGPLLAYRAVEYAWPRASRRALTGVSLEICPGEGVALLGHNGAGKSTLMRLGMALVHPLRGEVRVAGRTTHGAGPEDFAPVAGYLFQQPESQLFERTVRAEVAFGPRQLGWSEERVASRVAAVLAELELGGAADAHPYDLPLPQRRLVGLAAAVAGEPQLLLLDEPTAGLDRRGREIVSEVVRRHLSRGGAAVAVTHDTRFALETLERGVVLHEGAVVADGSTAEALASSGRTLPMPPHAAVAARLGLAPPTLRLADVAAALAERCPSDR